MMITVVKFPDDPEFERHYLVKAPLANPARDFLDAQRRRALLTLDGVQVSSTAPCFWFPVG
jgi:hypothetical protein